MRTPFSMRPCASVTSYPRLATAAGSSFGKKSILPLKMSLSFYGILDYLLEIVAGRPGESALIIAGFDYKNHFQGNTSAIVRANNYQTPTHFLTAPSSEVPATFRRLLSSLRQTRLGSFDSGDYRGEKQVIDGWQESLSTGCGSGRRHVHLRVRFS